MTNLMHQLSVPVFQQMLKAAKGWLTRAEAHAQQHGYDSATLLELRLAPDMLPFAAQIMIATDHAKGCAARLAGVELPRFEDNEKTVPELMARLDKTLAFLETVPADKMVGAEAREIVVPNRNGERRFVGIDYLRHYALPNFYFHITTAYALLRHKGVDIGKVDYLGVRA